MVHSTKAASVEPVEESHDFTRFQQQAAGTNIDEQTLLATDYLNHFNEIVMLLELVPDMPDCLEMAREWHPKSYTEHFRDSVFSDKDLAIAAYEHVPARFRDPFERTVDRMNHLVEDSLAWIDTANARDDTEKVKHIVSATTRALRQLIDAAGAIVHGGEGTSDQSAIDDLLSA